MVSNCFFFIVPPVVGQPALCPRRNTAVGKGEKPIRDKKKIRSRESRTPFWKSSKCVMTLREATPSTIQALLVILERNSVTGGKPARIRNRQATTERMKLTTWLRVMAEVMQLMAR